MKNANWPSLISIVLGGLCGVVSAGAQQVDHYTPDALLERAKQLQTRVASTNGAAAETLQKYGIDFTMLSFRDRDGSPELHEKFADFFVVIEGTATLLTGGQLEEPSVISPGEMHGKSIIHPTTTNLAKGDVVHIAANTPHQLLIPKGGTFTYFVIKVKEKE
jgi:mannose-6-phosphate isomerase-like protein (cupin superfamily)